MTAPLGRRAWPCGRRLEPLGASIRLRHVAVWIHSEEPQGNASGPLFRRACVEEVRGYDSSLKAQGGKGCEDWVLTLRIAETYDVRLVPAYLSGCRSVLESMSDSTASAVRSFDLVMERVEQSSRGVPPHFLRWARANFYRYLAAQSYNAGRFETTLHWLRSSV